MFMLQCVCRQRKEKGRPVSHVQLSLHSLYPLPVVLGVLTVDLKFNDFECGICLN